MWCMAAANGAKAHLQALPQTMVHVLVRLLGGLLLAPLRLDGQGWGQLLLLLLLLHLHLLLLVLLLQLLLMVLLLLLVHCLTK